MHLKTFIRILFFSLFNPLAIICQFAMVYSHLSYEASVNVNALTNIGRVVYVISGLFFFSLIEATKFIFFRGLTGKKLIKDWNQGFYNSTGGNPAPIQKNIDQFNSCFLKEVKDSDVIDITYDPELGVRVYRKGILEGVIQDKTFKKYLFGIWLGDNPLDPDLEKGDAREHELTMAGIITLKPGYGRCFYRCRPSILNIFSISLRAGAPESGVNQISNRAA